jgi:hypothetical protein
MLAAVRTAPSDKDLGRWERDNASNLQRFGDEAGQARDPGGGPDPAQRVAGWPGGMTHDELIAALQTAPEASRELDGEVHFIVLQPRWERDPPPPGAVEQFKRTADPYTQSLDVALRLVPEGFTCQITTGVVSWAAYEIVQRGADKHPALATTPALAVCSAALQARQTLR